MQPRSTDHDLVVHYFAPSDIQVARVDRKCLVHFCDALARRARVRLVSLQIRLHRAETRVTDPLDLYRIKVGFEHRAIRTPLGQDTPSAIVSIVRVVAYAIEGLRTAFRSPSSEHVVLYMRNYLPALAVLPFQDMRGKAISVVLEVHEPPRNALQRLVVRRVARVIANSQTLADVVVERGYARLRDVVATHQGVDLSTYTEAKMTKADARKQLRLPSEKKLVVYTGKIYWGYREVEYMLAAARLLRDDGNVLFVLVGGRGDQVERYEQAIRNERLDNVLFTGFVPPTEVPAYQFAADALILYYPGGMELNKYRSPGKLFEYMASERPIVAVDLPVLREVLGDVPAAVMVPADSPDLLAAAIERVLGDESLAQDLAQRARRRVEDFTVDARADAVLTALADRPRDAARIEAATEPR